MDFGTVRLKRIDSPSNPIIKELRSLWDRRARDARREVLIEGVREVSRAVEAACSVRTVAYDAQAIDAVSLPWLRAAVGPDATWLALSHKAFRKLSRRETPDGLAVVVEVPHRALATTSLAASDVVLVAVGTEKPGNLGALVRSCDAMGARAAIVVEEGGTDPWNANVVRASMGSVFSFPVVTAPEREVVPWLRDRGVRIVAATPHATADLWDVDLSGRIALVVGPEHSGLSRRWLDAADVQVRIPMAGAADSLNVSVTAAMLLYEARRQRSLGNE